jgi:acetyl-CoA acyltransferase
VIVDYARSAMGRSKNGCFRNVRADDLSVAVIKGLLARNEALDPAEIDDLIWGCVLQRGEQGMNLARLLVLGADLPFTIPAQTVNRLCGSSMSALHTAAANVMAGLGDVYLVGGVEHLGHLPMMDDVDVNPRMGRNVAKAAGMMGMTAEYLALLYGIGFPPFRGGVFRWMDTIGLEAIPEQSKKLAHLGKAYELTDGMSAMLADGKTYY